VSGSLDQINALARAFFGRFFESEITTGTDDLKGAFFWLLATLAVPGVFIPWMMSFEWGMLALMEGREAVRIASRAEKTFYLGYSMVASGVLTTIAWGSLLPDRRDTLILGSLPVNPAVVVAAKLVALAAYVGLVAVFMHAVAAVSWGLILDDGTSATFGLRGMVTHLVASSAASITVCLSVAAVQGLALSLVGARLFGRVSTVLQVVLVGLIALCLASLPLMASSVVDTLGGGPQSQPWILLMPPLWFLGLYEQLLGTRDHLLLALARQAWMTLALCAAVAAITYPIAYRRLMVSVVETASEPRRSLSRAVRWVLVRAAGRHASARAAADFFMATLARVERQRFVLAIALGLAVAWGLPGWKAYVPSVEPTASLLALPLASMVFLLAGLRIASSLPADVRAAWIFDVHNLTRIHARQAVERTMFLLGVLPALLPSAPVYWWFWGTTVAVTHALVMSGVGVVLIELLIWHCDSMPCGQRWTPARGDFGRRWPLHVAIFLVVVTALPRVELLLFGNVLTAAGFVACVVVLAVGVRYASATHQIVPVHEAVDPVAGVLGLS